MTTPKESGFTIRHLELANILEISVDRLNEIISFFDSDSNDQWELIEGQHFEIFNLALNEKLFS